MGTSSARTKLRDRAQALELSEEAIGRRTRRIYQAVLAGPGEIRSGSFTAISNSDLKALFEGYDAEFFDRRLAQALAAEGASLTFRVSSRMTRVGARTTHQRAAKGGGDRYTISVSSTLLFQTFEQVKRTVRVAGRECGDRLEALQRLFEHELIHLLEMLVWGRSDCSADRFAGIARRMFAHQTNSHELVSQYEVAREAYNIALGDEVNFAFKGGRRRGIVVRIVRRATVLVKDPDGRLYSDGIRYAKYYVPLTELSRDPI